MKIPSSAASPRKLQRSSPRKIHAIFALLLMLGTAMLPAQESSADAEDFLIVEKGKIRLELDNRHGSFMIYALGESGDPVRLLSNQDEGRTTRFLVRAGQREYDLTSAFGIRIQTARTPLGAQMAFLIPDVAQIVVDFSFLSSIPSGVLNDMLRVTVYTINLGQTVQSFTLKGVFDTVLGETTTKHFSTAARTEVNGDLQLTDMSDDLWVKSENRRAAIQFLLCGEGITRPAAVTMSTRENLVLAPTDLQGSHGGAFSSSWVPTVRPDKSFASILSSGNSALCINWDTAYLDSLKTSAVCFFISVATDGGTPAGDRFLTFLAEGKTLPGISGELHSPLYTQEPPQPTPLTEEEVAAGNTATEGTSTFVNITRSMIDTGYIQRILDRIEEISQGAPLTDPDELSRLNTELDAILDALGVEQ